MITLFQCCFISIKRNQILHAGPFLKQKKWKAIRVASMTFDLHVKAHVGSSGLTVIWSAVACKASIFKIVLDSFSAQIYLQFPFSK